MKPHLLRNRIKMLCDRLPPEKLPRLENFLLTLVEEPEDAVAERELRKSKTIKASADQP